MSTFSEQLEQYHQEQGVLVRRSGRRIGGAIGAITTMNPFGTVAGMVIGHHVANALHESRVALNALSSEGRPSVQSAAHLVAGATGGGAHPRDKAGKFARK